MYPASIALKGKAAMQGTDTEKKLATMLFDEAVQVLSSFELNQIASLTYNDGPCEEIFTMLEEVMRRPLDHSVLCVQKSLVVTKHVVIYGSEKCVNSAWALGRHVDYLREFNTVLAAQQRNGAEGWLQRIKGGGVDKGFPVREAASALHELLRNPETLQMQRHTHADPNSLVPVGDDRVAFVSDDVRHYMLEKRIEEQQLMHTKSNLAKERSGFGSGYVSKDGKTVVGAAHSVEEMLARANREKLKYTDDGPPPGRRDEMSNLFDAPPPAATAAPVSDLLDFDSHATAPVAPKVDLLDFSSEPEPVPKRLSDLLGTDDLLAVAGQNDTAVSGSADLLSLMTVESVARSTPSAMNSDLSSLPQLPTAPISKISSSVGMTLNVGSLQTTSVMSSNSDRFAALDALAPAEVNTMGSILSGKEAENRILGNIGVSSSATHEKWSLDEPPLGGTGKGHVDTAPPSKSMNYSNGLLHDSMPVAPPMESPEVDYSSMNMGTTFGNLVDDAVDADDDGFVMGGSKGSGLEPVGAAPAAPPPPPPPM